MPARELIFLTVSDHVSLHNKAAPKSETHKQHLSEVMNRSNVKQHISEATKAALNRPDVKKRHKDAIKAAMNRPNVKKRQSEAHKGLKWWNNGIKTVFAKECPGDGFMPGRGSLKRLL